MEGRDELRIEGDPSGEIRVVLLGRVDHIEHLALLKGNRFAGRDHAFEIALAQDLRAALDDDDDRLLDQDV
ncbi:hypothetical protein D3C78_1910180 [compost metagenome]